MPRRYDSCVKKVKQKIKKRELRKTYMRGGKRYRTNPYAICKATLGAKNKMPKDFYKQVVDVKVKRIVKLEDPFEILKSSIQSIFTKQR